MQQTVSWSQFGLFTDLRIAHNLQVLQVDIKSVICYLYKALFSLKLHLLIPSKWIERITKLRVQVHE